jgi:hypothetical protein
MNKNDKAEEGIREALIGLVKQSRDFAILISLTGQSRMRSTSTRRFRLLLLDVMAGLEIER